MLCYYKLLVTTSKALVTSVALVTTSNKEVSSCVDHVNVSSFLLGPNDLRGQQTQLCTIVVQPGLPRPHRTAHSMWPTALGLLSLASKAHSHL